MVKRLYQHCIFLTVTSLFYLILPVSMGQWPELTANRWNLGANWYTTNQRTFCSVYCWLEWIPASLWHWNGGVWSNSSCDLQWKDTCCQVSTRQSTLDRTEDFLFGVHLYRMRWYVLIQGWRSERGSSRRCSAWHNNAPSGIPTSTDRRTRVLTALLVVINSIMTTPETVLLSRSGSRRSMYLRGVTVEGRR